MGRVPCRCAGNEAAVSKSAPPRGGRASLTESRAGREPEAMVFRKSVPKDQRTQHVVGWTLDPGSKSQGVKPRLEMGWPGHGTKGSGQARGRQQARLRIDTPGH